jgi:hypothetical protein
MRIRRVSVLNLRWCTHYEPVKQTASFRLQVRFAMTRVLCVAEKPSIAKAVATHLSGGQYQTVSPMLLNMA